MAAQPLTHMCMIVGLNGAGKTTAVKALIESLSSPTAVTHGKRGAGAWVTDSCGAVAVLGRFDPYHHDTGSKQVGRADGLDRVFSGAGTASMHDAMEGALLGCGLIVADGSMPLEPKWLEITAQLASSGRMTVELLELDTNPSVAAARCRVRDKGVNVAKACDAYKEKLPRLVEKAESRLGISRKVVSQKALGARLEVLARQASRNEPAGAGAELAADGQPQQAPSEAPPRAAGRKDAAAAGPVAGGKPSRDRSRSMAEAPIVPGDRVSVEFEHDGEPTGFAGTVDCVDAYGRFVIRFDDGNDEAPVAAKRVRREL